MHVCETVCVMAHTRLAGAARKTQTGVEGERRARKDEKIIIMGDFRDPSDRTRCDSASTAKQSIAVNVTQVLNRPVESVQLYKSRECAVTSAPQNIMFSTDYLVM